MSLLAIVKIVEGLGIIASLFMKESVVITEGVVKIIEGIGEKDAKPTK